MHVVIGGGGTAGHINPGISIYQEIQKRGYTASYVLRVDDLTYNVTDCIADEDKILVSLKRVTRSFSLNSFYHVFMIFSAFLSTFSTIKKSKPDLFIMTGGYVSNIVALSAIILGKPLFIYESNTVAGITNRFWSFFSKKIFTMFPFVDKIPKNKIICTGNPILYKQKVSNTDAKEYFSLRSRGFVLGIMTGSQGSMVVNNVLRESLRSLVAHGYQIIWILGTSEYDRLMKNDSFCDFIHTEHIKKSVHIYRFVKEMDVFWSAIDLLISRSGAGTIAEAIFFQVPAILIPIKNSPDNHQVLNAQALSKKGCATIIQEEELDSSTLIHIIHRSSRQKTQCQFAIEPIGIPEELIVNLFEQTMN